MTIQQERDDLQAKVTKLTEQLATHAATASELNTARENLKADQDELAKVQGQLAEEKTKSSGFEVKIQTMETDHAKALKDMEASVDKRAAALSTTHMAAVGAQPLPAPAPSTDALPKTNDRSEIKNLKGLEKVIAIERLESQERRKH